MKKLGGVLLGILTGVCLFIGVANQPVLANADSLTVNIPSNQSARVATNEINLNSAADGSFTFTGKTDSDGTVTIKKHGGNNKEYTVTADEDGNFSKVVKMAASTKKCKFTVKSDSGDKLVFIINNSAYDKTATDDDEGQTGHATPVATKKADSESSSEDDAAESSSDKDDEDHSKINTDQYKVVGNRDSHKYHTEYQQNYHMNADNAIYFNNEADAQAAGFQKSQK